MAVLTTACGSSEPVGTVGHIKGFAGTVAADEPAAVLAARDVLSAGGNAADAAVTLYFSLAVTLPSTASLGGGGACVVYDSKKNRVEVLDFRAPAVPRPGELAMAVPANARGMFALWARYHTLQWESLLVAPERMARTGVPVSRALANDLAVAAPRLAEDTEAQRIFFRADGHVLAEGERMQNLDLAAMYSWLRRAPGDFYVGQQSHEVVDAVARVGGALSVEDLRDLRPRWEAGAQVPVGNDLAVLPSTGDDAGAVLAGMDKRRAADRSRMVAERAGANAARQGAVPGTGFVVIDSFGMSVACGVSANGLFGTGRVAPGTGMVVAAAPVGDAVGAVPLLLVNKNSEEMHFAGAAGGGGSPAASLAEVLLAVADEGVPLTQALARGAGPAPSRVNATACRGGSPDASRCQVATDPKGFGFATVAGR